MFEIHSVKADGRMHRIWHENVILEEGNDYVIGVNDHTPVTDSKHKIKETVGVSLFYFSKSDWFNVIVVFENESYYYYCNIASPARWQEGQLLYTDYDIDLIVKDDLSYEIVDQDEFEVNQKRYAYNLEVIEAVEGAVRQVKGKIARAEAPFNDQFVRYWYDTYRT